MSRHDLESADDDDQLVESFEEDTLGGEPTAEFESLGDVEADAGDDADAEAVEDEDEDGEEDAAPKKKRGVILTKPKANVYTVMMVVSLVALVIGSLCLYAEVKPYASDIRARSAR
jgi:hypothetical protein